MFGMTLRSQTHSIGAACAITLLTCTLLLAACSSGGTTTGSNTGGGSTNSTPTATAKSKPTSLPAITLAFCQSALTIAQANQILNPVNPVNNIIPDNGGSGGSCSYEYAPVRVDVTLFFEQYTGGSLTTIANDALTANLKGGAVTADQSVSGLGDQALFLAGNGSSNYNGVPLTGKGDILYVVDGGVAFDVNNVTYSNPSIGTIDSLGSVSDATIESEFEQIARGVMAAL
ncbi:MAG TPA: hypothetical protein VMV29_12115 [Ktedonobacterales bacterium]|nr:hypothetical protein [Ktedonobacterales bacterium]